MNCFIIVFYVFAKLEIFLGKYKKLCRYCEREDSYLFLAPSCFVWKIENFLN